MQFIGRIRKFKIWRYKVLRRERAEIESHLLLFLREGNGDKPGPRDSPFHQDFAHEIFWNCPLPYPLPL